MGTILYTGQLVTTSCWCGIRVAVPEELYDLAQRNGQHIYCPVGHQFVFGDTTTAQLKQAKARLAEARQREAATRDLLRAEERSHTATKGHVTRAKKQLSRIGNGVCPCCKRHFTNVERHMASKHPEFDS
jgi:hypothetical protein